MQELFFPHETIRPIQGDMVHDIEKALQNKEHILIHAPTGLGKSAAALAPAVTFALKNKLTVFFLTSRQTQHQLAIQTLQEIKKKYNLNLKGADIIGKKWMCLFPGVKELYSGEFAEFCKHTVETGRCEFYSNVRVNFQVTALGKKTGETVQQNIHHAEEVISISANDKICPYEITLELVKNADVVVGDYAYIFHPMIAEHFLKKTGKELGKAIVIVDEAHNLPNRIRAAASLKLTSAMLKSAIKEAKKYQYLETIESLVHLQNVLNTASQTMQIGQQKILKKEVFVGAIEQHKHYDKLIDDLEFIADAIRELQKKSAIGGVAKFLEAWKGTSNGFTRILEVAKMKNNEEIIALHYKCLDPAVVTKQIIEQTHTTILMSGTLTPTNMYRDLLGFDKERTREQIYSNPFPEKNRLVLVVPRTTTKFTQRNEQQFRAIAEECTALVHAIKGNSIIFFPSYSIRDSVYSTLSSLSKKTIFREVPHMTKEEKTDLLERFKAYKDTGAVLLAAVSGSYGEGIDLPGDFLNGVIIVGLPLQNPDLETKQLIEYFDQKFTRGWDYGYLFPAFNKALQNAGRCIRTEKDRGVIVFLDERYVWPMYRRCFPEDLHVEVSTEPEIDIRLFFGRKS